MRYDAFWVPGLHSDQEDKGLDEAVRWLLKTDSSGERVLLMNRMQMWDRRSQLIQAVQFARVASPNQRSSALPHGQGNVILAVWPSMRTLDLAEDLALDGSLCVVPNNQDDMTGWIVRSDATNLLDPASESPSLPKLPVQAMKALDRMIGFDGHNGFLGGGTKEIVIHELREMVAAGVRPDPYLVEQHLRANGEVYHDGERRLREWYEGILAGKRFRGSDGRSL